MAVNVIQTDNKFLAFPTMVAAGGKSAVTVFLAGLFSPGMPALPDGGRDFLCGHSNFNARTSRYRIVSKSGYLPTISLRF